MTVILCYFILQTNKYRQLKFLGEWHDMPAEGVTLSGAR